MSILLPLYIYPWPGVWDPLYWAAGNNTKTNFTIIINPCSGPCTTTKLESPYLTEIPKLKSYSNIRTLGYVATNYTNKPINDVLQDISTWNNWTKINGNSNIAVDGIFFDEVPGVYDWMAADYLKKAQQAVKSSSGLGQKVVVHNPGVIPGSYSNFLDLADITVIFENTYMQWLDKSNLDTMTNLHTNTNLPKTAFAVMLHSMPNVPDDLLDWTVRKLKGMAEYNFVSSVSTAGEYWHSFSSLFNPFLKDYAKST